MRVWKAADFYVAFIFPYHHPIALLRSLSLTPACCIIARLFPARTNLFTAFYIRRPLRRRAICFMIQLLSPFARFSIHAFAAHPRDSAFCHAKFEYITETRSSQILKKSSQRNLDADSRGSSARAFRVKR